MASQLTNQYLMDHLSGVHTPESFGRAIIAMAITAATSKLGNDKADSVEIELKATVRAVEPKTCVDVTIRDPITGSTASFHAS
jgi:hypothetical protein